MIKDPRISVITACYNHGRYVGEMIASVLRQTFQDFEMIIVDDGSTDNTAEILDSVQNEKIRVIHTENKGPAPARNLAIENAAAAIIMNLDADDMIEPSLLEKAYELFCLHPDAGIVYSDAECFGAKSGKYEIGEYSPEKMLYDNRIISDAFFKKEDWEAAGGYSGEFIYGLEDWDLWLSIIGSGHGVHRIPEKLVLYRTYQNQEQSRSGRRKSNRLMSMESLVLIFRRHQDLYTKYPGAYNYFSALERRMKSESIPVKKVRDLYFNLKKITGR